MTPERKIRLTILLGFLTALAPLSTDMYLPSIPAIAEDLAAPVQTVQISVSVFFLGMGIGRVFYGPLADALGRKRVILMGTAIFLAASFAAVFAHLCRLVSRLLQRLVMTQEMLTLSVSTR